MNHYHPTAYLMHRKQRKSNLKIQQEMQKKVEKELAIERLIIGQTTCLDSNSVSSNFSDSIPVN